MSGDVCWRGECRGGCYYVDYCSLSACAHEWLDWPESDTHECLLCGAEAAGPPAPAPAAPDAVVAARDGDE